YQTLRMMLSPQFIRENPEAIRRSIDLRHTPQPLDEWLRLDAEHRRVLTELERTRASQRIESKKIGATQDAGERARLIEAAGTVSDRIKQLEAQIRPFEERLDALALEFTNIPDED